MIVEGSAAVVTGGASGLGRACAYRLSQMGATVVVADLEDSLVGSDLPDESVSVAADVTDPEQMDRVAAVASEVGPVRVLVNCAGIGIPARLLPNDRAASLDSVRREVEVNLLGTLNAIQRLGRVMTVCEPIDGERAVIVCTASIAAFDGQVGQVGYSASKAGIVGATLPLARELAASAVRVVTVAPGPFDTPLLKKVPRKHREALEAQIPHPKRLGQPEEFASLVAGIVENPMLNGEVIRLDGGIRMPA